MAAPASNSMSVLRVSCPGMGFTITMGVPVAMLSAVINPPAHLITFVHTPRHCAGYMQASKQRRRSANVAEPSDHTFTRLGYNEVGGAKVHMHLVCEANQVGIDVLWHL